MSDKQQDPAEGAHLAAVRDVVRLVRHYASDPDPFRYLSSPLTQKIMARTEPAAVIPELVGLCYQIINEFAQLAGHPVDGAVDTFLFAIEANAEAHDLTRPPDDAPDSSA